MHSIMRTVFTAIMFSTLLMSMGAAWADSGLARHKQLYAVPAPGKVVIDGQLKDWDLSGQIEMYVISETKEMQDAKFAVMYDTDALYLSGEVRDTSPMMNRQDPKVNGASGWDADSCQFRLSLDATKPYPIAEGVYSYQSGGNAKDMRDDIVHLTLWNYTDRNEPCLGMQLGMSYRIPHPEWAPFGIVPSKLFQAKYLKAADGRNYTFEYRIPWTTLGAKTPPKGGDMVGGTVQFNWGQPDGLKNAGGAAWAYDVMAGPGFVFQSAMVWGKLFFAKQGAVARELVEAGVPTEKPLPLDFAYDLPADGQITLQLFDEHNLVRRILVAQGDRRAGHNIEKWDGMDDHGKPLTPGAYIMKGITHDPITSKFVFSAHNSGIPPYPTDDNKGGWGADHGNPTGCTAFPGGLLLTWQGAEYGWGVIRVDLDGHKQWGSKGEAHFIANDGKRYFTYAPPWDPMETAPATGIKVFDLADSRPLNYGNGSPELKAPVGGDRETDQITGLAYAAGKVYVSYARRNLIGIFNSVSGEMETSWAVPAPGVLATRPDGTLAAISDGKLVGLAGGKITPYNSTDLDTPSGIAVAGDGTMYVSNQGTRQDIAVFSAAGKLLRRIGKAGGRPTMGAYATNGFYQPFGMAIDARGKLWVAENSDYPKRMSVWNPTTGAFEREFFGATGYFGYAYINPDVPDEIYCHNVLWKIDWDKKTTDPITTIWRKTTPEMVYEPAAMSAPQGFHIITGPNGKEYGIGQAAGASLLYRRDGNLFKPFFASFNIQRNLPAWSPYHLGGLPPSLDDPKLTPNGRYFWQDANDDQQMQLNELYHFADPNLIYSLVFRAMSPDLTVWLDGGYLLKPIKFLDNGQPIYDISGKMEKNFLNSTPNYHEDVWLDPDGSVYTLTQGGQLAKWSSDGKLQWGYPNIPDWHSALGLPPVKPGLLHGLTGGLGVAGNFTGNMTYFGPCHLFTKDGIYAAQIFRDGRLGGLDENISQPEGQVGQLVQLVTKPGAAPRTFIIAGGQDGRVTEVLGLDTIKPLPTTTFTLTAEQVKTAVDAQTAYLANIGQSPKLVITADSKALTTGKGVEKSLDGARRFTARAAHDEQNLYVSFAVVAPCELLNAVTDPKIVYKGGNCLDIQLAADPTADPKRKIPAPGDARLLVTRQLAADGTVKPYAVLFRPKVKDFAGQPTVLISPTGTESFDEITVVQNVGLEYQKTADGFTAVVTVPLSLLGWTPVKGQSVKMDLGYVYGNTPGTIVAARSYVFNNSFSANVVNDVPNESRLEPAQWGVGEVE